MNSFGILNGEQMDAKNIEHLRYSDSSKGEHSRRFDSPQHNAHKHECTGWSVNEQCEKQLIAKNTILGKDRLSTASMKSIECVQICKCHRSIDCLIL